MINNDSPVDGITNADGEPMTRGDLLALQMTDLKAIAEQASTMVAAYEDSSISPVQIRDAILPFARHLVSYTHTVADALVTHDMKQMYATPMPTSITIPDSLPEDFA